MANERKRARTNASAATDAAIAVDIVGCRRLAR